MSKTKETIHSVAIDLFYEKGYFATSISEIAKRCGIQKASIYYYYPSKEHLLYNIHRTTLDELTDYLRLSLDGVDAVEDKMRAAVNSHVHFHLTRQKATFIANSELRGLTREHYLDIVEKRDGYESTFQDIIRQGCSERVFVKEDIKVLSYAILTLCTSGAFWFRPSGRLNVDEIATIYENFILRGLKSGNPLESLNHESLSRTQGRQE